MTQQAQRTTVRAEIVLDVICVHSYLGYTRFARAAERLRATGVAVEVDFLPFELAPGAGTVGAPLLEVLERTFGPQAVAGITQLAAAAVQDGLDLHYERAVATGTFEAHRLIALAAAQGRAEQMVERLFRAHFTDGLHIGDAATLAALAAEVGVRTDGDGAAPAPELLQARLDLVRRRGITAIPVFLIDGVPPLTGSQSESALFAALQAAAGAARTA
ncbi:DsbA family protein [Kitasatospora sp. NPDC096128]|uniref:DsbA family oxidoreductase n=1 Tax=Kitasatospora sp. NPDC096128 TaxID=3155547 RepID=UPI003317EDD4